MTLGVLAWPLRYIIFVIGAPAWLVIASLSLHGFCYVFFFTAAFIYVDTIAPPDIRRLGPEPDRRRHPRASGNFVGSNFSGWIQKTCSRRTRLDQLAERLSRADGPDPLLRRPVRRFVQGEEAGAGGPLRPERSREPICGIGQAP